MTARLGSNPSYVWTSLHATQDLVRRGTRWKVGSGIGIHASRYPWIDDDQNFYVRTQNPSFSSLRVADFINHEIRRWNVELLKLAFSQVDVERITHTAIPPLGAVDKLVWHYSKDGSYSVKSAYKLAAQLTFDPGLEVKGNWKELWNLRVPPKVRDFLWRVCRDCLPHKSNLRRKHIITDSLCPMCNIDVENSWHLFMNCSYAREVWRSAGMDRRIEGLILTVEGIYELVMKLIKLDDSEFAVNVCMLLWQLWKERNCMVWESKRSSPVQVIHNAATALFEWNQCQKIVHADGTRRQTSDIGCSVWHKPPTGYIKVNVDASFFADTGQTNWNWYGYEK